MGGGGVQEPSASQQKTREGPRTFAPVDFLAADAEEALGTVVHTLAVLADAFPADEQEEPLLARGAAILLRTRDTACAVASQDSAYCSQTGAGVRTGREVKVRVGQPRVSHSDCLTATLAGCVGTPTNDYISQFPW
jgi:hypothetical protein